MLDATSGSPRVSRLYDSTSLGTSQACCSKAILLCFQSDEYFAVLSGPLHWCHPVPNMKAVGGSDSKNTTTQIQVATGTLVAISSDNAAHRSSLLHLIPTHRDLTMTTYRTNLLGEKETVVTSANCNGCPILMSRKTNSGHVVLVEWEDDRYAVAFVPDYHIEKGYSSWAFGHYFTDVSLAIEDFRNL